MNMNSLLTILQLYKWIQNTINTTVKRNTRKTYIKKSKKYKNTHKTRSKHTNHDAWCWKRSIQWKINL